MNDYLNVWIVYNLSTGYSHSFVHTKVENLPSELKNLYSPAARGG